MTYAWRAPLKAANKLALLAMCDWANDDGGSLYPSISKVAERMSCTERQAKRIVHQLILDGWISVVGNANGGAPGCTRRYQINVKKVMTGDADVTRTGVMDVTPKGNTGVMDVTRTGDTDVTPRGGTGDISGKGRVTFLVKTGDTGVTLSTIEPSINNQYLLAANAAEKKSDAKSPSRAGDEDDNPLNDFFAEPKEPRGSRLPADWTLPDEWRDWAERYTNELDIAGTADQFRDYWVAKSGAAGRKADWYATWRNWCRRANERNAGKQFDRMAYCTRNADARWWRRAGFESAWDATSRGCWHHNAHAYRDGRKVEIAA